MLKTVCAFLLLTGAMTTVFAQRVQRFIASNTVLEEPGTYILVRDLSAAGDAAITIRASNVTLDLNGNRISGPGTNTGTGILVSGATGVTIKNGYLRDHGFGVTVMNSNSVTLERLSITGRGIAVAAPPPEVGIMIVNSKAVTVKHNNIYSVGLGVFVRGTESRGNHIFENTITANLNGLLGICYNPAPGGTGGPRGDTVERNAISGFENAIQVNAGGPNVFKNNTLLYLMQAFEIAEGNMVEDIDNTKVELPLPR